MITHGNEIKLFSGNSNRPLAEAIAAKLNTELGGIEVATFSDGEINVHIEETVRGRDLFIIQSTSSPVNDNLMELLIMIDAAKRASAGRITAVIPYFGYARQDRKAQFAANPITARSWWRILSPRLVRTECLRWIFMQSRFRAFSIFR